ncbi:GspH/FimT family pseudopilin [Thermogutta sp.]|uniref:GspH/FimT family pseudopilin n=1 Tax=Thermogutta sp. TaxID=1962930 RepID=UPI003C7BC068
MKTRDGVTLLELMIVILLMAIIAGLALPGSQPTVHEQLRAAANIVASELELARSLAVSYNSNYTVFIDDVTNGLALRHTGVNAVLNSLPRELITTESSNETVRIVNLTKFRDTIGDVRIAATAELGAVMRAEKKIEFGPEGMPTSGLGFIIWLKVGREASTRYVTVIVDGETGKVTRGPLDSAPPPAGLSSDGLRK